MYLQCETPFLRMLSLQMFSELIHRQDKEYVSMKSGKHQLSLREVQIELTAPLLTNRFEGEVVGTAKLTEGTPRALGFRSHSISPSSPFTAVTITTPIHLPDGRGLQAHALPEVTFWVSSILFALWPRPFCGPGFRIKAKHKVQHPTSLSYQFNMYV